MSSTSQTNPPYPTFTSFSTSELSSSDRTIIIASVLGASGGILIISIIVIYLLARRKAKKPIDPKRGTREGSHNGKYNSVSGVPFLKKDGLHDESEISRPPMVADTSYQGVNMRGGQTSYPDLSSEMETDRFLPSHEEMSTGGANESHLPSDPPISPLRTRDPFSDQNRLSQVSRNTVSPERPGLIRHDTMGFPLDDDDTTYIGPDGQQHRISRVLHSTPILSPSPIHPSITQQAFERGIWESPTQDLDHIEPQRLDSLTSNYDDPYEPEDENDTVPPFHESFLVERTFSPVSVPPGSWIAAHNPHLAVAGPSGGVRRNLSVRTVSSFAPSVVSDAELERLGVGRKVV